MADSTPWWRTGEKKTLFLYSSTAVFRFSGLHGGAVCVVADGGVVIYGRRFLRDTTEGFFLRRGCVFVVGRFLLLTTFAYTLHTLRTSMAIPGGTIFTVWWWRPDKGFPTRNALFSQISHTNTTKKRTGNNKANGGKPSLLTTARIIYTFFQHNTTCLYGSTQRRKG